jgi:O-acetyl-ADP-ribose deacetylase (regulator of RNase III)
LETAEKLAIKTIAIPALGAGIGALSITKVARIFYDEIKQYLSREKRSLVKVYIVILEKSSFELFIKIMEEMTNANAEQLEE